ncbi:MAG: FtsX-like permease family protein [Bacteroidales bacterium]
MIKFLFLGLIRDKHRSLLPAIVVALGVMLTVVFHSWLTGIIGDSIEFNANFTTGHVKVMTSAYADNINQMPNDLALLDAGALIDTLNCRFQDMEWVERINFAGIIDVPDKKGETKLQGNTVGFGIKMLSEDKKEMNRMNIPKSLVKGRLPQKRKEVLISNTLADKLKLNPGDTVSLISSTMYGELSVYNFIVCGTLEFGTSLLDRGTMIADLSDVREALNMEDATGEILGFIRGKYFNQEKIARVTSEFNRNFYKKGNEFSSVMKSLKDQNNMGALVDYSSILLSIMIIVFLFAMSIVLWNAGLLGGLRRYGEFGMRLAIGEEKGHIYKTMIYESLLIGIIGSFAGVFIGMGFAFYLQKYGIDFGVMTKNSTVIMPSIMKARITPVTWFIGFIPGILSTLLGTMLSGIGIYKRQTAQLFKELET